MKIYKNCRSNCFPYMFIARKKLTGIHIFKNRLCEKMCITMSHILRMNNLYVLRVSTSTHIILFTHTFFTRRGVHSVYKYKQKTVTFMSFVCNFGSDR